LLHLEIVVKSATPGALGEGLSSTRCHLIRSRMFPVDVVTFRLSMMRNEKDFHIRFSGVGDDVPQIIQ
jgi:hypothetical protein